MWIPEFLMVYKIRGGGGWGGEMIGWELDPGGGRGRGGKVRRESAGGGGDTGGKPPDTSYTPSLLPTPQHLPT